MYVYLSVFGKGVFMKVVVKLVLRTFFTKKKAKTEKNVCPDLALVDLRNSSWLLRRLCVVPLLASICYLNPVALSVEVYHGP